MRDVFPKPAPPLQAHEKEPSFLKKLSWFALLAMAGVLATAGLAYGLRALLFIG